MRFVSAILCATLVLTPNFSMTARAQTAQTTDAAARSRALDKIFDDYWQYVLKSSPETATFVGDPRYNDQWSDYSAAAFNNNMARERELTAQLAAIDTTGLPEQQRLSAELLMRTLIDDQEAVRFKEWQLPVSQMNGPQTTAPQVIAAMSFETVKDYDNYIARLNKIQPMFQQTEEAMSAGADEGRTQPKLVMDLVLTQVTALATAKPDESPFAAPLKKMPASIPAAEQKRIRTEAMDAVTKQVLPAYDRFGRYLKAQYIPKCRTTLGASQLPDGKAFYELLIRRNTTTKKSAEEIHQIGLAEVAKDEAAMLVIAKKMGFADVKSFNASLKTNPKTHPTSEQQWIDAYKQPIAQMQAKLPQIFGRLPKAQLEVLKVPDYMAAQQSQAYYQPGTPDGKRPGQVFVNTYHWQDRALNSAEVVAYHEGLPGHHLQISIGQELDGIPEFRKNGNYNAFVEGWGLYAEQLGKDLGFYQDPLNDYGRLQADVWRAIRLVVDTGVHAKGWTRQQMVDYFHDHSNIDETNIQAETDRYIGWPGQALGYKMGQLEILDLRERAKAKLGANFNLKAFHDEVLDSGALPLDVLDRRVDAWIAAGGK